MAKQYVHPMSLWEWGARAEMGRYTAEHNLGFIDGVLYNGIRPARILSWEQKLAQIERNAARGTSTRGSRSEKK